MSFSEKEKLTDEDIKEVFDSFDKNGNGAIDKTELAELVRCLGLNPTKKEANAILKQMNVNKNGEVEFDEFAKWIKENWKTPVQREQELIEAFKVFDLDNDGVITREELRKVLTEMGDEKLSSEEADELFDLADLNKDGHITFSEYVAKISTPPETNKYVNKNCEQF